MQIVIDLSIVVKKAGRVYFCIHESEPSVCRARTITLQSGMRLL